MNQIGKELNGAWEERGVIGTRIEIDGNKLTVLWRSAPVLETTFRMAQKDGLLELKLKHNGLRYQNDVKNYATIRRIIFADGKLEVTQDFPISGESQEILQKTDRTRYGNYEIDDSILPQLQGTWKSNDGYFEITFHKDKMNFCGLVTRVHALKPKNISNGAELYMIADQDSSVEGWHGFSRLQYYGGILTSTMFVCDAPSVQYIFKKV
ncbi:MAG: hypothetical protein IKI29_04060 [Clostridia bacterium]|nr:hypothetical protein [Clostridia bacterium]